MCRVRYLGACVVSGMSCGWCDGLVVAACLCAIGSCVGNEASKNNNQDKM